MTERSVPPEPTLLVVPRDPGPLVAPIARVARRDDVDELLDELLGEVVPDQPGAFDVVLALGGVVAVAAYLIGVLPTPALVVGVVALGLGLVLPLRNLARAASRRRDARELAKVLGSGSPLNVDDPLGRRLAEGYAELRLEAEHVPVGGSEAVQLAHEALLEVTVLLRGRPATGPAEVEYVRTRAEGIEGLAAELARRRLDPGQVGDAEALDDDEQLRGAAVRALERLDEITASGSVHRMSRLRDAMEQGES